VFFYVLMVSRCVYLVLFFFFQAEDGIRDATVTGVQTCALPISASRIGKQPMDCLPILLAGPLANRRDEIRRSGEVVGAADGSARSEERRVGKECRSRRTLNDGKKKEIQNRRNTYSDKGQQN